MTGFRLYKKEKLCSTVAIEQLFGRVGGGMSAVDYPLRAVWRKNDRRHSDAPIVFMITVPKKKLRHAVDRVKMRRRIREAYRLSRNSYPLSEGVKIDVAFVYLAPTLMSYAAVARAMESLLGKIQRQTAPEQTTV